MSITPISDKIKNDSLAMAILAIMKAMQADYGALFTKQFPSEIAVTEFKQRLYRKLKGLQIASVIDGYEAAAEASPKFCPNAMQVVSNAVAAEKDARRKEKNRLEAERVSALPPPTITCNPIAMLREAMAKIAAEEAGMTKEQKRERHWDRLKAHEALMAEHMAKIRHNPQDHLCAAHMCGNAGTMSHGITSGGNYYCSDHFRRNG